ncbi:uncharacterized protein LOC126475247 isoform X1 [Schistocerca serialis cubense]|uniref:uncharacterized protein LOC126475247 isoform X1 n=2 Tax=Schistocerca serialis cubense TaxID=2023355 RepID=UPI00214F4AE3|nr:uncharacterized protein LOC126475247 isoform X1 [Schistocerca serialis cubense]
MAGKPTPMLLVTANVGSIFEDPTVMLKIWIEEFLSTVSRLDPKFIALHCQEVGGKNYERSMKHVEYFVRLLMSSEELRLFDRVRVYLDEDYSSAEHFTALGNFYFVHESLSDVLMWDFSALTFVTVKGKDIHSGNIEAVSTKEKSKFPQDFFPECKWSRKGFLRTRWNINGTVFDLINIHLFHDASNFIAMESFPSVYCKNRRRALEHTLDRFHNDDNGNAPFFLFGDFNFRIDTQGVVKKLAEGLSPVRLQSNKNADLTKLQYRDGASQVILSLGKKEFSHQEHQKVFVDDNAEWLREFDKELEPFSGQLFEFVIKFPPSYPFEENEKGAKRYMQTRCPSWCDRVVLSYTAKSLICNPNTVEYGLMGINTCMGDHKPVFLKLDLIANAGMISCCTYRDAECESPPCFGRPVLSFETNSRNSNFWPSKHNLNVQRANTYVVIEPNPNTHFLALPQSALLHEPYTPESVDTPSSSPVPSYMEQTFEPLDKRHLDNVESSVCLDVVKKINESFICDKVFDDTQTDTNIYEPVADCTQSTNSIVPEEVHHCTQLDNFRIIQEGAEGALSHVATAKHPELRQMDYTPLTQTSDLFSVIKNSVRRSYSTNSMENVGQSFVETNIATSSQQISEHGVRKCRCFSDSWSRKGTPHAPISVQPKIRVRLISDSSSHSVRLQSHHSSSDEDWFEEVASDDETSYSREHIMNVDCILSSEAVNLPKETVNRKQNYADQTETGNKCSFVDTKVSVPVALHMSSSPSTLLSSVACDAVVVNNPKSEICDSVLSSQKEPDLPVEAQTSSATLRLLDKGFPDRYNSEESGRSISTLLESLDVPSFSRQPLVGDPQLIETDASTTSTNPFQFFSMNCCIRGSKSDRSQSEREERKQEGCCCLL